MNPISNKIKLSIVARAAVYTITRWGAQPDTGCLYYALSTLVIAREYGLTHLVPQAGTALWRGVAEEHDDGVSPTHCGYEWDPESESSRSAVEQGQLPEIHIWVGDPLRQEVIDLTTKATQERFMREGTVKWTAADLPSFVWGKPPDGAVYIPNREATLLAVEYMKREMERP